MKNIKVKMKSIDATKEEGSMKWNWQQLVILSIRFYLFDWVLGGFKMWNQIDNMTSYRAGGQSKCQAGQAIAWPIIQYYW